MLFFLITILKRFFCSIELFNTDCIEFNALSKKYVKYFDRAGAQFCEHVCLRPLE